MLNFITSENWISYETTLPNSCPSTSEDKKKVQFSIDKTIIEQKFQFTSLYFFINNQTKSKRKRASLAKYICFYTPLSSKL